jgi:hypothetical protein
VRSALRTPVARGRDDRPAIALRWAAGAVPLELGRWSWAAGAGPVCLPWPVRAVAPGPSNRPLGGAVAARHEMPVRAAACRQRSLPPRRPLARLEPGLARVVSGRSAAIGARADHGRCDVCASWRRGCWPTAVHWTNRT